MSTYLVAFVVGEFEYRMIFEILFRCVTFFCILVEDHTKEGIRVRIYTPLGKKETGKFALGVASKFIYS
jgi:puromycin-sensitive aminopeptidase